MDFAINVQEHGVTGNGVTDDAPALNDLFNAIAAAGPTTVYFPRGTYLIKGFVYLDGSSQSSPISGLHVFADPGTIIKAATIAQGGVWGASASAMFQFRSSASPATNVLIEGFTFDGQSFGTTGQTVAGIYTTAITGLTVRNCIFKNIGDTDLGNASARNDGIILGDNAPGFAVSMRAKDVLIEKCRFISIVRNGISGLDVDGLVVDSCTFDGIDNSGIDCEPNIALQFARDIKITRCTFNDWYASAVVIVPGVALLGSTYPAQMEGVKVTECYMDGATVGKSGVSVRNWLDVNIANNTVVRVADPAIYLQSCVGVRVAGNHVRDASNTTGAILISQADAIQPQDHVVQGNTVKNSAGYGIRISDLDTGAFVGNTVRVYDTALAARTGISFSVSASTCRNIAIVANNVTGGGARGRRLGRREADRHRLGLHPDAGRRQRGTREWSRSLHGCRGQRRGLDDPDGEL